MTDWLLITFDTGVSRTGNANPPTNRALQRVRYGSQPLPEALKKTDIDPPSEKGYARNSKEKYSDNKPQAPAATT
jgi:hypothetical protein